MGKIKITRGQLRKLISESTVSPTRVMGPEGADRFELLNPSIRDSEKSTEVVLQAANSALSFRSAIQQLSQATIMLSDTPQRS